MSDFPPNWTDRHAIAAKRIQNILRRYTVVGMRTLEQKIADAGPNPQRVQPHYITDAKKFLVKKNLLYEINESNARWCYLHATNPPLLQQKLAVLSHLQERVSKITKNIGQALEISIFRALQAQTKLKHWGFFRDLEEHDDSTLYKKTEPPSHLSGTPIPNDKQLDFLLLDKTSGLAGIEAKNIREWIYPDRAEVRELLLKCCVLDAVPILVARRINFATFSVLNPCGVLFHETYNQLYPTSAEALAREVQDKELFGFHDVRIGNEPDSRLTKFIGSNLPDLLPEARKRFDQHRDLLYEYGKEEISYDEFKETLKADN